MSASEASGLVILTLIVSVFAVVIVDTVILAIENYKPNPTAIALVLVLPISVATISIVITYAALR